MSHEITVREDGFAEAAYSIKPAWHGLGQIFDRVMTSSDAIHEAGLGWLVEQVPVYRLNDDDPYRGSDVDNYEELPRWKLNVRSDNQEVLGMVGSNYKTIQNWEGFELLDSLIMDGLLKYECAFSLRGGAQVVMLAKLPGVDEVAVGDTQHKYICCKLDHTGKGHGDFFPTSVRTVCSNTLRLAMDKASKHDVLKVRHSGDTKAKLSEVRDQLALINDGFDKYTDLARTLAKDELVTSEWNAYKSLLFPIPALTDADYSSRKFNKVHEIHSDLDWNFYELPTRQGVTKIDRTKWAAFNAVTHYVDHRDYKGKDPLARREASFVGTQEGAGNTIKQKAFRLITKYAR